MLLTVGGSYYDEFCTAALTGVATDADSTPAATANRNGTDDAGFVLTVTKVDTGRYKVTGTVPSYTAGDIVNISVAATISTTVAKCVLEPIQVVALDFSIPTANQIWDAAAASHTTAGTTGAALTDAAAQGSGGGTAQASTIFGS